MALLGNLTRASAAFSVEMQKQGSLDAKYNQTRLLPFLRTFTDALNIIIRFELVHIVLKQYNNTGFNTWCDA